jgi:LDH2 family malate/lactate/ureidoglycolate dehydrogenase
MRENLSPTLPKPATDSCPPLGDYKVFGLAMMVGLLGGVLNGAAMGRDVTQKPPNIGQFIAAISIE